MPHFAKQSGLLSITMAVYNIVQHTKKKPEENHVVQFVAKPLLRRCISYLSNHL
jgi:hypothetical protein